MQVHIIGAGLIGTSLGIALSRKGYAVTLADASPTAQALAQDLGAGTCGVPQSPDVVVVAAPPDVVAVLVADALQRWPRAVVTDVASVKEGVVAQVHQLSAAEAQRFVPGHPMAGRERSGASSARGDLFVGRTWVLTPSPQTPAAAVEVVARLAADSGASVRMMGAGEHDIAVAAVSHVPQVAASLVAQALSAHSEDELALAGQGLRDTTRIAASDPRLWTQILAGNAVAVAEELDGIRQRLDALIGALRAVAGDEPRGALAVLSALIADGNTGHSMIPGKHGAAPTAYMTVVVVVPDRPGELARLLADVGAAEVNLEDLHIEHEPGQGGGLAELAVLPATAPRLREALAEKGWRVHE